DLRDRIVANEIYDVVTAGKGAEAAGLPDWLTASPAMVDIARAASTMGTKLWLTPPPPGQRGELDGLIACAQMTTCYNLVRRMTKAGSSLKRYFARRSARLALTGSLTTRRIFPRPRADSADRLAMLTRASASVRAS